MCLTFQALLDELFIDPHIHGANKTDLGRDRDSGRKDSPKDRKTDRETRTLGIEKKIGQEKQFFDSVGNSQRTKRRIEIRRESVCNVIRRANKKHSPGPV